MRESMTNGIMEAFGEALRALNQEGIPFVIGGAFAIHYYSGAWRNTNDLDIYLERKHVRDAISILEAEGFSDFGEMAAGDREWIHHALKDHALIDLIWQPPNHLWPVDESFYRRGVEGSFAGVPVRFIPPDELVWAKIFTMNLHRCDWPDIFKIIRSCPDQLDWRYLLDKMGSHWPVLLSFLVLFEWAYPSEAECIPLDIRDELFRRARRLAAMPGAPIREAILDPWVYTRPVSP